MFKKTTGTTDEGASVSAADVNLFHEAIDPIVTAGKLGVLLAQFPPSFKTHTESREYLEWLVPRLSDCPVAVELRHRNWSDDIGSTLTLLNGLWAAWVQIDEPKFSFSIEQNYLPNVTSFYYMRLHGRNAAKWWHHELAEDRYDYLYTSAELTPFSETADATSRLVKKLSLYLNKHFAANAVANAVVLKDQLGLPTPGQYPLDFAAQYPEVDGIVKLTASANPLFPLDST